MAIDETVSRRLLPWVGAHEADWDAIYREQLPRVYNFFRYRVGRTADAEDLTAATFEKAWRARHRYRRDLAGFTTWLLTIARNVAADHFRSRRDLVGLDRAASVASGALTPEERLERQSDADRLSALLAELPTREQELVALKYGAGLTNREIAAATGLSESNVGTILHRTVQTLRSHWSPDDM
jgi:RNA polymerase sigma-70 factor (ECF subfamily)